MCYNQGALRPYTEHMYMDMHTCMLRRPLVWTSPPFLSYKTLNALSTLITSPGPWPLYKIKTRSPVPARIQVTCVLAAACSEITQHFYFQIATEDTSS